VKNRLIFQKKTWAKKLSPWIELVPRAGKSWPKNAKTPPLVTFPIEKLKKQTQNENVFFNLN